MPDIVTSCSDAAFHPGAGPDAAEAEPDGSAVDPDASGKDVGSYPGDPDAGDTEPDAGDTEPDAGDTEPDAGDTEPDAGDTEPDAGGTSSDWYLDCEAGSDTAGGHSEAAALRTLGQLNARLAATKLRGGQSVRLARGTTCRGSLTLALDPADPFTTSASVGAYGDPSLARPVISGTVPVQGWTLVPKPSMNGVDIPYLEGAPIYRATSAQPVKQLFADGERQPIAAYNDACNSDPANGNYRAMPVAVEWDFLSAVPRLKAISSFSYPLGFGFTPGEELLIRVNNWYWARRIVAAMDASTGWISFTGLIDQNLRKNSLDNMSQRWGFTLRNALNLVTCPGEWTFNPDTKELHLWSTAPTQRQIEVSVGNSGVLASGVPNQARLELRDLVVRGSAADGILLVGKGTSSQPSQSTVSIENVSVEDANEVGLRASRLGQLTVSQSNISGSNARGLLTSSVPTVTIRGNTFHANGSLGTQDEPGQSLSSITVSGSFLVEGNRIADSGYAGISVGSSPTGAGVLRGNDVSNYCLQLNDCGGIYVNGYATRADPASSAPVLIEGNLVRGGAPNVRGVHDPTWMLAAGVYLDWMMSNVTVRDNAVLSNTSRVGGVFLHGGSNNLVEENTVFQIHWPDLSVAYDSNQPDPKVMTGNTSRANVFYTQSATNGNVLLRDVFYEEFNQHHPKMLNSGVNYYLNPLNPFVIQKQGRTTSTFSTWTMNTIDAYYTTANTDPLFSNTRLVMNEGFTPMSVALDESYCDKDGSAVQGTIAVEPLSARVLVRCYCNRDGVCNNRENHSICAEDCP
ncbi:MAG: right-handed parallel beta-helix repeat-containing protein [Deltaproteobacteria bacterium]|nr:right-handed parallel beta-helix repeat-containing protein [Deltaproteobacteria bacterium]